jgi:hypothetical protein
LLSDSNGLVVQSPMDCSDNLNKVRLGPHTKCVNDCSETIQDGWIVSGLLVKSSEDAIHQLVSELFSSVTDFRAVLSLNKFLNGLHDHFSVGLVFVFEAEMNSLNNFSDTHFNTDFSGGLNELAIVSLF